MLEKYADLIVRIGVNLQEGQELMIVNPPLFAQELVHAVTKKAYQAGAKVVSVLWQDQMIRKLQLQYGSHASREAFAKWSVDVLVEHAARGEAQIVINGRDPDLYLGEDPEAVRIMNQTTNKYMKPLNDLITASAMNWCHVSVPVPAWAKKVFPELPADQALSDLWNLIYEICRINQSDSLAAWREHLQALESRADYLNQKAYQRLHYRANGTDLQIGLPIGHIWQGGSALMKNGIRCVPNLPTEEVFTMPHKTQVDGYVRSTKPLVYQSTIIDAFTLWFEAGRVTWAEARTGEKALQDLLQTDEGASMLGEVALISKNSPVGRSGYTFHNMLYDENSTCHLALGRAFKINIENGYQLDNAEFSARGGNNSLIHADFMIGSDTLNIDGIAANGHTEPIFRAGDWVI